MDRQERVYEEFQRFESKLAGDESEDLATVVTHVRLQTTARTQIEWARMRSTRQFLDLGLHLLYQRHFHGDSSVAAHRQGELFPHLRPEDLANHASDVIRDQAEADSLSRDRWARTWSHQGNYIDDLIAYLFRPGPYVLRIHESQLALTKFATRGIDLGQLVRLGVKVEMESNLNDPLIALQTFVQTALPTRSCIQDYARRLDETNIALWERLYSRVFPAFDLQLRDTFTWGDVARTFTVVADGVLLRTRVRADKDLELISNREDVLSTVICGMIPTFFDIAPGEAETRRLEKPIADDLG
jgi:hypothetical protein